MLSSTKRLDAWDQRPMLKSYVSQLLPLRLCRPTIDPNVLRKLPEYFESPYFVRRLDPSYEPMAKPHHPEHEAIFSDLQELRAAASLSRQGRKALILGRHAEKGMPTYLPRKFYWQMVQRHRYESWYHGPPGPGNVWQYRLVEERLRSGSRASP